MASGLLGIGTSALLTYQRALNTVSHNIANVNTDGYSRQRVELSARQPQPVGSGFIGTGVETDSVRRIYDQFLTGELQGNTASYRELDVLHTLSAGLDNLLADENAGLSPMLNAFFNSVQDAADDPTSIPARQVMLSSADTLAARFHDLSGWMQSSRDGVNQRIATSVQQINQLSGAIADINTQIISAQATAGGQPANDLLDQRDQLVLELSGQVSVSTVMQDNGSMNVFMGSGQVLVLGAESNTLVTQSRPEDPGQVDIAINAGGSTTVPVTGLVGGGELGGLLKYREQVLDPAENSLGRIAVELGSFMNDQHRMGISLDGMQGQDLFNVPGPQVIADPANSGNVSVAFGDVAQLTTHDYRLAYEGGNWSLTQLPTGQPVAMSGSGTAADPFTADGLGIVVAGGAAPGDNYLVRPTRGGASAIDVAVVDPRDLALAVPLTGSAATGNTGTGQISAGTVTDIDNPAFQAAPGQLSPEVLVRFTSPGSYEVLDQSTMAVIDTGVYDPATGKNLFPTDNLGIDYGYQVSITGNPVAGDEFAVDYNSGGTGDNRNALLLAGLQVAHLMDNGTASFNDSYGQLVAEVGTRTQQAQVNSDTRLQILQQNEAARASVSGVNLDEEAADMLRFQQAYQAAAQVIAVADQMFDTLINAVGR